MEMDLTNELIKQIISNGKKLTEDSNFTDELNKCIKNLKDNYNFKNLLDIFSEQSENEDNSEDKCSSKKEEKNDECEFTEAPEDKKIYSKNTMDDFIKDLNEDSSKYIKKQKDDNKSQYKDCNRYPETDSKQEKTLCEELLDELKETVTKEDMIINDVINIVLYIINNRKDEKGYFKFGGSTTILFFEKDAVKIDNDILEQSKLGFECKVQLGEGIGTKFIN